MKVKFLPLIILVAFTGCCQPRTVYVDYLFTAERISCYNLVAEQTDNSPLIAKWYDYTHEDPTLYFGYHCAISPDVRNKYGLGKHDTLYIDLNGQFKKLVVTDITAARFKHTIDILENVGSMYLHKNIKVYKPTK